MATRNDNSPAPSNDSEHLLTIVEALARSAKGGSQEVADNALDAIAHMLSSRLPSQPAVVEMAMANGDG